MYQFGPVTDRVTRLRERFRNTYPRLSVERLRYVTEFYREHPDEMGILKRAKLLRGLAETMTVLVEDDELLVGNMSSTYRGAIIYPEYGNLFIYDEIRSGVWDRRTIQDECYTLTPEDKEYIMTTEGFWRKNGTCARLDATAPDGYWKTVGTNVIMYRDKDMADGPTGHFCANYDKVLYKGFRAIREEALRHMEALEGRCFGDDAKKYTFYKAVTIVSDAAMLFPKRYAALCREKAETASEPRRAELLKMAEELDWILENPVRTFREAVQALLLYQVLMIVEGNNHALSWGRADQYLGRYLDADLEAGRITLNEAQELIDCFFLKISDFSKTWSAPAAATTSGYTTNQHMSIGGVDKEGRDASNKVTFLLLGATARLLLHDPPMSLRVHDGTPDLLWEAAMETTKRVGGIPTMQNDNIIIPALMKKGLSLEDARNYCIIGCVEPTGTGCEWAACGGSGQETYFNLLNALQLAINNGVNPLTNEGAGVRTGYLYDMMSFDEVKEAYVKQVDYFVDWQMTMTNFYELVSMEMMPLPMVSATMDGCMEKGADVVWGGAKYNSTGCSGVGCANVADGLAAIKHLVFDTKKYTAREFYDALMAGWDGYEAMRQEILNSVPRYGNDDPYVDELARWATQVFIDRVNLATGPRGGYRPGLYPVSVHIIMGRMTAASPDGRLEGEPLADGISPKQGLDRNGPTAILKSAARLDHLSCGNGTLLNMRFHPKSLEGIDGGLKLKRLVQTFFDLGGMHVQYNVVGSDTLRAAQKDPEGHKNLVIRVAGFSAYFTELYEDLQNDIISRTELSM
jgi:pyruvate formate-lyase/glycerol dehydratase family glycyl radical enzyme